MPPSPPEQDAQRYGTLAIVLHWLLVPVILGTFGLGLYMSDLPFSPARLKLFNWHKWAGVTVLTLSALRLLWRLRHPPPPLPAAVLASMPAWQRKAYAGTHLALYLLFFAVPLLGWAYSSAAGISIVWFGVLPLPDWVPVDKVFARDVLKPMHKLAALGLGLLVLLHIAAALKHQFVDGDGLLARMWPPSRLAR